MAKKITPPVETPAPDTGAGDLAILHPDATRTIAGRTVTVRAYRFITGLSVRARAVPLTRALHTQIQSGSALVEDIIDVLAAHEALTRELMLDAIDGGVAEPRRTELSAWIDGLDDADAELLLLTWWSVCGPFFVRQIVRRIGQTQQLQIDLARIRAGSTSTPASPLPATGMPSTSETPSPSAS